MNTEIASQIAHSMKQKTMGIEIECYVPNERLEALEMALSHALPAYRSDRAYSRNRSLPYWIGKPDGSLSTGCPRDHKGREYVSPPLKPVELFIQLEIVTDLLNEYDVKVRKSCGLHVHCDAKGYTPKRLQYLVNHMVKSEKAMDSMLAPSRRGEANQWCNTMQPMLDQAIDGGRIRRGGHFRYRNLNLVAFLDHGTVEFRQHQGTLDFEKIVYWSAFCQATAERCRLKVPRTESYQNPMHNVLIALKLATANLDGTLRATSETNAMLIRYVAYRMRHFGFTDSAPEVTPWRADYATS